MKSGEPNAIDDLKMLIGAKRSVTGRTLEVVSNATRWLKAALKGADVNYNYSPCEEKDHYGFAAFIVVRTYKAEPICLDMKIAEIRNTPFIFAEIRSLGKMEGRLFPYFGEISSDEGRELLLHYISDFILSTS